MNIENKQSSIDWLLDQITYDNGYGQRRCSFIDTEDLTSYFEQAKVMHKEEIQKAFTKGNQMGNSPFADSEWYYIVKFLDNK